MRRAELVVTLGANRSIGFELARKLTVNGHQVFGTYRPTSTDDDSVHQVRCEHPGRSHARFRGFRG